MHHIKNLYLGKKISKKNKMEIIDDYNYLNSLKISQGIKIFYLYKTIKNKDPKKLNKSEIKEALQFYGFNSYNTDKEIENSLMSAKHFRSHIEKIIFFFIKKYYYNNRPWDVYNNLIFKTFQKEHAFQFPDFHVVLLKFLQDLIIIENKLNKNITVPIVKETNRDGSPDQYTWINCEKTCSIRKKILYALAFLIKALEEPNIKYLWSFTSDIIDAKKIVSSNSDINSAVANLEKITIYFEKVLLGEELDLKTRNKILTDHNNYTKKQQLIREQEREKERKKEEEKWEKKMKEEERKKKEEGWERDNDTDDDSDKPPIYFLLKKLKKIFN